MKRINIVEELTALGFEHKENTSLAPWTQGEIYRLKLTRKDKFGIDREFEISVRIMEPDACYAGQNVEVSRLAFNWVTYGCFNSTDDRAIKAVKRLAKEFGYEIPEKVSK